MSEVLTQKRLKELLSYNSKTGVFIWLCTINHKAKKGALAGDHIDKAYCRIGIDAIQYKAHRLAFLYMIGRFPVNEVDHIDHNKRNNIWGNLRECTRKDNCQNSSRSIRNTSGITGVHLHKPAGKWLAKIMVNGKSKHLGLFVIKEQAILVRKDAEIKYGFHKNHGKLL